MGKHLGYRATKEDGGWKGWAWDPNALPKPTYKRKRGFVTEAGALGWAKDQHARFITRLDHLNKQPTKELAEDYHAFLEKVKKRTESHRANVRRALDGLAKAVPDITHARAAAQCEEWLGSLDIAASTRVQYLVTCKALCKWALRKGRLTGQNPLANVEVEDPESPLRAQFTFEEMLTIANADRSTDFHIEEPAKHGRHNPAELEILKTGRDPYHRRACLLLYTGMRIEEATFIQRETIDIAGRVIPVRLDSGANVKGRKERLIPIMSELLPLLQEELDLCKRGPLFVGGLKNYWREFQEFLARHRIPRDGRSPHSSRHSYAGVMTATGVPSLLLAAYMGHSSVKTTATYSKLATRYTATVMGWERGDFRFRAPVEIVAKPTPALRIVESVA